MKIEIYHGPGIAKPCLVIPSTYVWGRDDLDQLVTAIRTNADLLWPKNEGAEDRAGSAVPSGGVYVDGEWLSRVAAVWENGHHESALGLLVGELLRLQQRSMAGKPETQDPHTES